MKTSPVDSDVQALIMSQKEMQDFANIYRSDNDRGTCAWFDASLANWSEGFLSPKVFEHIFDQESATEWLDKEIENFIDDGRCPADYVYLKSNPAFNPVIVVFYEGKAVIWDGYHRIAAAVHRNMPIYAIFTAPPAQLLRPVELPEDLNDKSFQFIADKFQCSPLQAQFILVGCNYTIAEVQRLNATVQPVSDRCKVPNEPTPEMQTAGATAIRFDTTPINKLFTANAVYRAMLAAVPGGKP